MANKGYNSYRGRRRGKQNLLIFLLVLVLLAACAFIFLQRYVTYADDGSFYLDLPFFQKQEPPPAPAANSGETDQNMNLIIDTPEDPEPEQTVSPYGERRLVELAELPADASELSGTLEEAGANGFVCTLRDNTGRVYFDSTAAIRTAVKDAPVGGAALSELCAADGVVSVARLNCFHDSYYAWDNMESAGICQSTGYIWYDNLSYHWLDPAKGQARRYVISLALECAELGFDELLLEEACYPASGNLEKIDYAGNELGKTEALVCFLTELREAISSYDVKLSLLLDGRLFIQEGDYAAASGQELAQLLPLVDAVYVSAADVAAAQEALAAAAGEEDLPALVPITETAGDGGNWYLVP